MGPASSLHCILWQYARSRVGSCVWLCFCVWCVWFFCFCFAQTSRLELRGVVDSSPSLHCILWRVWISSCIAYVLMIGGHLVMFYVCVCAYYSRRPLSVKRYLAPIPMFWIFFLLPSAWYIIERVQREARRCSPVTGSHIRTHRHAPSHAHTNTHTHTHPCTHKHTRIHALGVHHRACAARKQALLAR